MMNRKTAQLLFVLALVLLAFFILLQHMHGQTNTGPMRTPQINQQLYVGQSGYPTIQRTVTSGCGLPGNSYAVIILPGVTVTDTPSAVVGGCTGTYIEDRRSVPIVYYEWNGTQYVKVTVGGGNFPVTTNLVAGDGNGGGADSGIAVNNVALLNAANTFTQTPQTVTNAGSTTFNVLSTTEGSYPMYVIGGPSQTWGLGTGGTQTPFVGDFYIKFLPDNIPVMQLHGADHSWSFWGNGGVGGSLAVNAGGYEIFCTPGYSFCVNDTPAANPNEVYNFTIDPQGNTKIATGNLNLGTTISLQNNGGNISATNIALLNSISALSATIQGQIQAGVINVNSAITIGAPGAAIITMSNNGAVQVGTLTCTGMPCGSGGGSGGTIPHTTNVLQGDGNGNAAAANMTVDANGNAAASTLTLTSSNPPSGGLLTVNNPYSQGYTTVRLAGDADTWQFSTAGSETNPSIASNWYVYDEAAQHTWLSVQHNTGLLTLFGSGLAIGPYGGGGPVTELDSAGNMASNGYITAHGNITGASLSAVNSDASIISGPAAAVPSAPTALGTVSTWNLTTGGGETDYTNVVPTTGNPGGFMWLNTLAGSAPNVSNPLMRLTGAANLTIPGIAGAGVNFPASGGTDFNQIVGSTGAFYGWNASASYNEMDFVDVLNSGQRGGFTWYTAPQSGNFTKIMDLDGAGNLNTIGSLATGGAIAGNSFLRIDDQGANSGIVANCAVGNGCAGFLWPQGGAWMTWNATGNAESDFFAVASGGADRFVWYGAVPGGAGQSNMLLDSSGNLFVRGTINQGGIPAPFSATGAHIQPMPLPGTVAASTLSARPTTNTGKPSAVVPTTPKQSKQTCRRNSMWHDDDYIYVCVAKNEIKRAALSSFQ